MDDIPLIGLEEKAVPWTCDLATLAEMRDVGRSSEESTIVKEIESRAKALKPLESYYVGRLFPQPVLPQGILMFNRNSRSELIDGGKRQRHHRYVLLTAVRSGGQINIDNCVHSIREGESLLILPLQRHWYVNIDRAAIRWVFVTFDHERDSRLEVLRDRGAMSDPGRNLERMRDFMQAWQTAEEKDDVRLRLSLWLNALIQQADKKYRPSALSGGVADDEAWMAEINRIIFARRKQMLSLGDIAKHLRISRSLLQSRFRFLTGRSLGGYVREAKLQYACELLYETDMTVGAVAEQCGYESAFSFSRAFQKVYAVRPTIYRKAHKAGDSAKLLS